MTGTRLRPLNDVTEESRQASSPALVPAVPLNPGGVDPLGLRQLNFDLMDRLLPGINNEATRLRPYVVIAWAWWRAAEAARAQAVTDILPTSMKAFVDRIEVAFATSHLLAQEFDGLPGRQVLDGFRGHAPELVFDGDRWKAFQSERATTTSLMAPVSYGPSAKEGPGLGFLRQVGPDVFKPAAGVMAAVMALDEAVRGAGDHPLFWDFEPGSISIADLQRLHAAWRVGSPTDTERQTGRQRFLYGHTMMAGRQRAAELITAGLQAADRALTEQELREALAAFEEDPEPSSSCWRAIQCRQLLRLSLEALLYCVLRELRARPLRLEVLAGTLLRDAQIDPAQAWSDWLDESLPQEVNPAEGLNRLYERRRDPLLVKLSLDGLRASLACARLNENELNQGQLDRLPAAAALRRADELRGLTLGEAVEAILAEWVIGQHVYWAIGRSGDETQRLRLMLEEGGWTALVSSPGFPRPTPDRLGTALSLMADCGMIQRQARPEGVVYRATN